jgi:hypothetical protein
METERKSENEMKKEKVKEVSSPYTSRVLDISKGEEIRCPFCSRDAEFLHTQTERTSNTELLEMYICLCGGVFTVRYSLSPQQLCYFELEPEPDTRHGDDRKYFEEMNK